MQFWQHTQPDWVSNSKQRQNKEYEKDFKHHYSAYSVCWQRIRRRRNVVAATPVAKIGETEYESLEAAVAAAQSGDEIVLQIMAMPVTIHSLVLFDRYVQNKTLVQISEEQHYSYTRICHIHGEALRAFSCRYLQDDNK